MSIRSLLVGAVVVLSSSPAAAQTIYLVDTTADSNIGTCTAVPSDCALRGAITAANSDGTDSQIFLTDEIYQLTIVGSNEDNNSTGDLDVLAGVEILAVAGASPVIEQTTFDRVIEVVLSSGTFRMVGSITITGGRLLEGDIGGGAIRGSNFGGAFELEDVVLTGNQVGGNGGCLYYSSGVAGASILLHRVTLSECHSELSGGGAYFSPLNAQATITSSLIDTNTADFSGGGLYIVGNGSVVILDTTIRGNLAGLQASGFAYGGGIYRSGGDSVLRQSTVSDNQIGVATTNNASGGGFYTLSTDSFLVENSTISGNRTDGVNQFGAGIHIGQNSSASLDHTSVVDNSSQGMEGILVHFPGTESLAIKNSIIDNGCRGGGNSFVSSGFNVERPWDGSTNTTCNLTNPSDLKVTDLMLRPLAGYGGPTYTHALLPGSPAQSLVSSAQCQNEDQRHAVRQGLFCDSGAYDDSSVPPGQWIFADGFESGNTAAWSDSQP